MRAVFVTGGNRGIGLAICSTLLETKDVFVFLGSRKIDDLTEVQEELSKHASDWESRVDYVKCDVADDASVTNAAAQVGAVLAAKNMTLHAVINNAGVANWGPGIEVAAVKEVINTNYNGPKRVFEAFQSLLKAGSRFVNVSSASGPMFVAECSPKVVATITSPDVTVGQLDAMAADFVSRYDPGSDAALTEAGYGKSTYGFSKALLNGLTLALHRAHGAAGITVNACTPGYIATGMTAPFLKGRTPQEAGMKSPKEGAAVPVSLAVGPLAENGGGKFYGSDGLRSPLDRYRSPGDPEYTD